MCAAGVDDAVEALAPVVRALAADRGVFVTGTDTEVGKTIVTGVLVRALRLAGRTVVSQKWVQTGATTDVLDINLHDKIAGIAPESGPDIELRSPYRLEFPASPHFAAALEGVLLKHETVQTAFRVLQSGCDIVVVEGAGGLMTPVTETETLSDWVRDLGLPVIVVVPNRLGALNHTLLTLTVLHQFGTPVRAIVLNTAMATNAAVACNNRDTIRRWCETMHIPMAEITTYVTPDGVSEAPK